MKLTQERKQRFQIFGIAAAVTVLLSLSLLSTRQKKLSILVRQGVEGIPMKNVAERFSHNYHVEVQVVELPYEDLRSRELKDLSKKDGTPVPDVILLDDPWLPALLLDPMDPANTDKYRLEEQTPDEDFVGITRRVSQYPPCPDSGASCPGKYYAVPFVGNSQLFCYLASNFPPSYNGPQSWQEVLDKTAAGGGASTKGVKYIGRIGAGNSIVTDFITILWSYDPDSFQEDSFLKNGNKLRAFANPQRDGAALQILAKLVGKENATASVDDFDLAAYLAKDKAAMGIVWSAWAMRLMNLQRDVKTSQLQCRQVPGTPEVGAWLLAIPVNARHKDQAKDFIEFATNKEQLLLAALDGNPPPRRSILEKDSSLRTGYSEIFGALDTRYDDLFRRQLESLQHAKPRPRTPCWREVEDHLGKMLSRVVEGDAKPEDAVNKVNQELGSMFANGEKCRTAK